VGCIQARRNSLHEKGHAQCIAESKWEIDRFRLVADVPRLKPIPTFVDAIYACLAEGVRYCRSSHLDNSNLNASQEVAAFCVGRRHDKGCLRTHACGTRSGEEQASRDVSEPGNARFGRTCNQAHSPHTAIAPFASIST